MRKPVKGFITYSHEDTKQKDELRKRLAVMEQNEELVTWHDGQLPPGDGALPEDLLKKVADSDLLFYLVSAASLASTNCNKELAEAIGRDKRVVPIILEHCDWLRHQLSGFEVLPHKGKPINDINEWNPESKGWQNVVDGIRKVVEDKIEDSQNVVDVLREGESKFMSEPAQNERLGEQPFQLGNFFLMLEQTDRAIEVYSQVIDLNLDFPEPYNNRGLAYANIGEFDAAIADYNTAIALNPDDDAAYYNRGNAYVRKDEVDTAIQDFNKALVLNPAFPEAYNNRGNAYVRKDEFDAAIADYNTAIALNPDLPEAYNNRGFIYAKKSEFDTAIRDFNKALVLNPDLPEAYCNRGFAYVRKGEVDAAIADYNKAIALDRKYAGAYCNRGEAWLHLKDWQKAEADLTTAKDMGYDIIASFQNDYESVEDFEAKNGVKIPEDIAALLRR